MNLCTFNDFILSKNVMSSNIAISTDLSNIYFSNSVSNSSSVFTSSTSTINIVGSNPNYTISLTSPIYINIRSTSLSNSFNITTSASLINIPTTLVSSNEFSHPSNGVVQYNGIKSRSVFIDVVISIAQQSSGNNFTWQIRKNGISIDSCPYNELYNPAVNEVYLRSITSVSTNDTLSVYVQSSGAITVNITDLNICVNWLS